MIFDSGVGVRLCLDAAPAYYKLSDKCIFYFHLWYFYGIRWREIFLRCVVVIIRWEGGLFANFLFRKLMQM